LQIEKKSVYIREINRILDNRGILFLKCFSTKEPRQEVPYTFSEGPFEVQIPASLLH
jgi:hypothetical protein